MKRLIYIVGVLVLVINWTCTQQKVKITQSDLIGEWTCYKRHVDYNVGKTMLAPDADYVWLSGSGNLVFKGDSMWYFDYPREYHESYFFKIESNELMLSEGANHYWELNKLELNGDSLVRIVGNDDEIIRTEYYVRDTFEKEIIQVLLRDSVNTEELIGQWFLEKFIEHVDSDADPFEIFFPFELPDSLVFSKESLPLSKIKGRKIIINIEGKPREFRFGFTQEDEYSSRKLWLRPTAWYEGEELRIHYY